MQKRNRLRPLVFALGAGTAIATGAGALHFGFAQPETAAAPAPARVVQNARPQYDLRADIDTELLTFSATANVTVPAQGAPIKDAVFFLYANADGVGGAGAGRKNLKVESVSVDGAPVKWNLNGAVLRAALPAATARAFAVQIAYKGVVPRSDGKDDDLMGGLMSSDISGMLGLPGGEKNAKPKADNTDYGLYTASRGIVSLGAFWYPQLAARQNGKWADAAPAGLGDVAFSEKSDYRVSLGVPAGYTVAAPGLVSRGADGRAQIVADNVRECAVLMSSDYISKSKVFDVAGRPVKVEALARRESAAKVDQTLDVAGRALQIYAKRFGPYRFDNFKVVEAPMKSGAGGMEYSAMTGIASGLYGDMGAQLGGMMSSLNIPGADELLKSMGDDTLGGGGAAPGAPPENGGADGGAGGALDMVGGIMGQQKEMLDSLMETTVAHEVAHQWWAIGVGSDSQNHPFVDESLTNWSAMLYYEDRYGKAKAQQMSELNLNTSFSMGAMLGGGDKPANLPTAAYTNNLQYGAVIYGKGALYYQKLRELVGDEAFFGALREYYARFDDKLAGPGDLKAIVIEKAPTKRAQINALYTRWIDEAHGKEDIKGGMLGGMDLGDLLGGALGGLMGGGGE